MKILSSFSELQKSLKMVNPYKIAVAYIGEDYDKFINPKQLKEIIISPTIGSNPKAISSIVKTLDWDNVHFLDNLHSKIYLGKTSALIGSPNLSRNALDVNGLYESAVLITDRNALVELNKLFNNYKLIANKLYQNENLKVKRLQNLYHWHSLNSHLFKHKKGIQKQTIKSFDNYSFNNDKQFKVIWYDSKDLLDSDYNKEELFKEFKGESWKEICEQIYDTMPIAKDDHILLGDWILCFMINEKFQAKKTGLTWHLVQKFVKNSLKNSQFPNSSLQLSKAASLEPPFKIDNKFKQAFVKVINLPKYKIFREYNYGNTWLAKKTIPFMDELICDIKKEYK